jgi:protein TonB
MEDHKRLILPAIAAIVLHGFLVSFNISKHDTSKPIAMGNPVRVEINAFSPQPPAPEKVADDRKVEGISPATSRQNIEPKEVPVQQNAVPQHPKKIAAKQAVTKKAIEPLQDQPKEQAKEQTGSPPGTTFTHPDTGNNEIKEIFPEERSPIGPKQQTAMPVYQRNQHPSYPVMAKQRGHEGQILLQVLVNTEGAVSELKIKQSSGHSSLDTAALAAVKNWLFTPATEGGRAVSMWVDVPIEFRLKSNDAF